jgi:mRNA interferase MazF
LKRGELYRVRHPSRRDPKRSRVFVLVSRQVLIDSRFSKVMCVPVYSAYDGLATQVLVGGTAHESSLHCDEVVSLEKPVLSD